MSLSLTVLLLAVSAGRADSGIEHEPDDSILVMKLRAIGVDDDSATLLSSAITEIVSERSRMRVISTMDVNTVLAEQSELQRMDCLEEACLVELSRAVSSRFVVSGTLGMIGKELLLSVGLIDAKTSAAVGRASRAAGSIAELTAMLPGALAEVFGWQGAGAPTSRYRLPERKILRIAMLDLVPLGLDKNVTDNLSELLASELKRIKGTRVTSRADIVSMLELEGERSRLGCTDNMACMAEIGGALGVSKLVVGHAGQLAESYIISLRLIDVKNVRVVSRVTETFAGQEGQLLPAIRRAGRRLLGIEDETPGTLAISANEQDARLYLDNNVKGELPLPPLTELSPGRHSVRLEKTGFLAWRSDVFIEPGGTTPLWAELETAPRPWYRTWWVWTLIGATAAAGGLTTYLLLSGGPPPTDGGNVPF